MLWSKLSALCCLLPERSGDVPLAWDFEVRLKEMPPPRGRQILVCLAGAGVWEGLYSRLLNITPTCIGLE